MRWAAPRHTLPAAAQAFNVPIVGGHTNCHSRGRVCEPVGTITEGQKLTLKLGEASLCFWDFATAESLTGFGSGDQLKQTNDSQSA